MVPMPTARVFKGDEETLGKGGGYVVLGNVENQEDAHNCGSGQTYRYITIPIIGMIWKIFTKASGALRLCSF